MNRPRPKPPAKPRGMEASPEHRRDIAIASAAQAFAVLCEALTEAAEMLTEELRRQLEEENSRAK